jgi:asparagine synthase (glutamine-hydrolysing)
MCGVVGIFSQREPVSAQAVQEATRCLHHRGPELQRHWFAPHGRVGLGHARLSIIDLVTGEQPILSEDGRSAIVVNGEFYDYERIQRDLEANGHQLRTRSDSEIALHLYEERGPRCLEQLRGEFAFILWDEANGLLFAARDRFGIKPLFYAMVGSTLYVASEAKALFAAGVPARWDREAVFQHLFACLDQDRTLFEGVFQVPPGHYLLATRNRVQLVRYWDLDFPRADQAPPPRSDAEYIEELRGRLDEAIRLRMRADVPVGCFLSGGIDSSAVLGMAARHSGAPIRAFTVTFGHPAYDEGPIARETAARAGADYHPIPLDQADFADYINEAVWHGEMLGYNAHAIARYLQSRAVHEAGYKVVLSGDGADEVFAGYIYSRLDFLRANAEGLDEQTRRQRIEELLRNNPAFRTVLSIDEHSPTAVSLRRMLGFVPAWLYAMDVSRSRLKELLARDFLAEFAGRDPLRVFLSRLDLAAQVDGRHPVMQANYLWAKSFLPNQVLFADRMEMAHAVEVRMPFLDHHVFELVREMPATMLIRGLQEKYVLREAARPCITERVHGRPKHPFTAPHATLSTNNRLHTMTQDVLRSSALADVPFFDQRLVIGLLDRLPQMDHRQRIALDQVLLLLLSACLLQKQYELQVA